jgi:hypothetical protein
VCGQWPFDGRLMRFLGACIITQVVLFWAKMGGWLDWPWAFVFAPIWIPSSLGFFLIGTAMMLATYAPTAGDRE